MRRNYSYSRNDAFLKFFEAAKRVYMPKGPSKEAVRRNGSKRNSDIEPWQMQHLCEVFEVEEGHIEEIRFERKFALDPFLSAEELVDYYRKNEKVVADLGNRQFIHRRECDLVARNPSVGYPFFTPMDEGYHAAFSLWRHVVSNSSFDISVMMYGDHIINRCCEFAAPVNMSHWDIVDMIELHGEVRFYILSVAKLVRMISQHVDAGESQFVKSLVNGENWTTSQEAAEYLADSHGHKLTLRMVDVQSSGRTNHFFHEGMIFKMSDLLYHARLIKKVGHVVEEMILRGEV